MLTVAALFFLGGETLRGFSLCLMIGLVTGTYSSVYIAAPIIVEWYDRRRTRRRPGAQAATGSPPARPAPRREAA
jgi:SecD/SecF fusion protein